MTCFYCHRAALFVRVVLPLCKCGPVQFTYTCQRCERAAPDRLTCADCRSLVQLTGSVRLQPV